jgi:hypothetical protein
VDRPCVDANRRASFQEEETRAKAYDIQRGWFSNYKLDVDADSKEEDRETAIAFGENDCTDGKLFCKNVWPTWAFPRFFLITKMMLWCF